MRTTHDNDCEWRLGHDCTCASHEPRTVVGENELILRLQSKIARLTAALAESEAKLKQAVEAETRACAEVVWLLAQGFAGMGSGLYMEAAHKCRDAILSRLDQPAGEA